MGGISRWLTSEWLFRWLMSLFFLMCCGFSISMWRTASSFFHANHHRNMKISRIKKEGRCFIVKNSLLTRMNSWMIEQLSHVTQNRCCEETSLLILADESDTDVPDKQQRRLLKLYWCKYIQTCETQQFGWFTPELVPSSLTSVISLPFI